MFGFSPLMMGTTAVFEEVQSLPAMTGATSPAGHVATASSNAGGYDPYKAFDKLTTSGVNEWATAVGVPTNGWVARQTPAAILVWKYRIGFYHSTTARAPRDFRLQGSNDGTTWTDLDIRTGQTGWSSQTREFVIAGAATYYNRHRLFVSANNGDGNVTVVSELELLQVIS